MRSGVFLFLQAHAFYVHLQQQLQEELQVRLTSC